MVTKRFEERVPSMDRRTARLTARGRDVLAVSATGRTSVEVAETLGLAPEAVRGSIASAITMLGARSKLEALVIAVRDGLINLPGS
jgi:DNA-binding CsgD family transcriptional regulator